MMRWFFNKKTQGDHQKCISHNWYQYFEKKLYHEACNPWNADREACINAICDFEDKLADHIYLTKRHELSELFHKSYKLKKYFKDKENKMENKKLTYAEAIKALAEGKYVRGLRSDIRFKLGVTLKSYSSSGKKFVLYDDFLPFEYYEIVPDPQQQYNRVKTLEDALQFKCINIKHPNSGITYTKRQNSWPCFQLSDLTYIDFALRQGWEVTGSNE